MTPFDEQLKAWLASFSGIDGGNPWADVWVCGIEHGGECESLPDTLEPESSPGAWTDEFKREHPSYTRWQYNQKVAKLMVAIRGWRDRREAATGVPGWREYLRDDLYNSRTDGDSFKLNLFPLSSRTVDAQDWSRAYGKHSALSDKAAYYDLCRNGGRFRFFREQRERYRPKVVVGTGITFSRDFALAFGFEGSREDFELRDGRQQSRPCHVYADASSVLIVSPFFGGRYGVNSNDLLIDLARHVAQALREVLPAG